MAMVVFTEEEKRKFEKWIIESVDETIVPSDEGHGDGLAYNLIHLLRGDGRKYNYEQDQEEEIFSWGKEGR